MYYTANAKIHPASILEQKKESKRVCFFFCVSSYFEWATDVVGASSASNRKKRSFLSKSERERGSKYGNEVITFNALSSVNAADEQKSKMIHKTQRKMNLLLLNRPKLLIELIMRPVNHRILVTKKYIYIRSLSSSRPSVRKIEKYGFCACGLRKPLQYLLYRQPSFYRHRADRRCLKLAQRGFFFFLWWWWTSVWWSPGPASRCE